MSISILFAGDINLVTVTDPKAPFAKVADIMKSSADARFANLENCFYQNPDRNLMPPDGFHALPSVADCLKIAGFEAVGTANNGNFGSDPIVKTIELLDKMGIKHTGSGQNAAEAAKPAIINVKGVKVGFIQRTSVYWPIGHEAGPDTAGVAVLQANTAYRIPMHRAGLHVPPLNRPGVPPEIVTWCEKSYLKQLQEDIEQLRSQCDVVIASQHWGLKRDVLDYMHEIRAAAIDAGADAVIGHGPHHPMAVEIYKGRPVFYSLSSFSFNVGHRNHKSGNWLGQIARITFEGRKATGVGFRWVRHNESNETYFCDPAAEAEGLADVAARSKVYGTQFTNGEDEVLVAV